MSYQSSDSPKPLISFVIPYYNIPSDMLMECVDSIVATNLEADEYEILIIDDGSDADLESLAKQHSPSVVYIRQENQGLSGARNTGINHSSGQYIQFVDSDDTLISRNYDHCIRMVKDHQPDMLLFQASNRLSVSRSSTVLLHTTGTGFMTLHNLHASAWGYLFRRDLLADQRFTPGILHEDEEFTPLLMLKAGKLISTDIKAYFYRTRPGSIIHTTDTQWASRRLADKLGVISRLNNILATLSKPQHDALQRRVDQLSMDYLYQSWTLTHSIRVLRHNARQLRSLGLFPLRNKPYTLKYRLFRIFTILL